jgi:hypothetical protein
VRRQGNSSNTPALRLRLHALRTVHRPNPLRELAGVPQMSGRHNVKHCTDQRFCHGPHAPRGIGEGPHPDRHMAVFRKSYTRPRDDSFLPGELPPFPPRNFRALSPMRVLASQRAGPSTGYPLPVHGGFFFRVGFRRSSAFISSPSTLPTCPWGRSGRCPCNACVFLSRYLPPHLPRFFRGLTNSPPRPPSPGLQRAF